MDLFEFEGKGLLSQSGIPTPGNAMLYSMEAEAPLPYPFVLKAQVLTGGRGKAGGIQVCASDEEYRLHGKNILGMQIKGHQVYALLAEEMAAPDCELYLSISRNGQGGRPLLMASPRGGMDIEQVAKQEPEQLLKLEIDPFIGLLGYQHKRLAQLMPMVDPAELRALVDKLYAAFQSLQATLIEINPLGVIGGKLVALDAKVSLDDNAARLQSGLVEGIQNGRRLLRGYQPEEKENNTITFVPLEGGVGLISDGAGTGMLALDLVADAGGRVASFCELGGLTNADVMYRAMEKTFAPGNTVKSLLVVLIGGFNRMDDMAEGITRYRKDRGLRVPVFTRMCGTKEEEGKAIMQAYGLATYDDLMDTVALSVSAAEVK